MLNESLDMVQENHQDSRNLVKRWVQLLLLSWVYWICILNSFQCIFFVCFLLTSFLMILWYYRLQHTVHRWSLILHLILYALTAFFLCVQGKLTCGFKFAPFSCLQRRQHIQVLIFSPVQSYDNNNFNYILSVFLTNSTDWAALFSLQVT